MKKRVITLLLSVVLAVSSIGTVPVLAAESETQEEGETEESSSEDNVQRDFELERGVKGVLPQGYGESAEEMPEVPEGYETEDSAEIQKDEKVGATSGSCGDNATWKIASGTLTISGKGAMADYDETDAPWKSNSDSITSVVIGSGITKIGAYAFVKCSKMTKISIPATVSEIGNCAFVMCSSITSIVLPAAVTAIPYAAFADCSALATIKMPGVTSIEDYAFQGTAIKEFVVGKNLKTLSDCALFGTNITSFKVETGNTAFSVKDSVLYSKDGSKLVAYPSGNTRTSFSIPSGVKTIGASAFARCSTLASITIPKGVTTLEDSAFQEVYNLKSVDLPDSLKEVGNFVFYGCSGLESISFGKGLSSTGYEMFEKCTSLKTLSPEDFGGITSIDSRTFANCTSLEEVSLPDSVKELGAGAFGQCYSLTSFKASKVKEIPYQCFLYDEKLTDVALGEGLTHVYRISFITCSALKEITLPASVIYVDPKAFSEDTVVHLKNPDLESFGGSGYRVLEKVTVTGTRDYDLAYSVLSLVNKERAKKGLKELYMESSLLETAMVRAAEIAVLFSHTRPDGSSCFYLNSLMAGENIAGQQTTAEDVMNSWMNSEGHRDNILNESFTSIGIGYVKSDDGGYYWVQCFGTEDISGSCAKPKNKTISQTVSIAKDTFDEAPLSDGIQWGGDSYTYSLELSGNEKMELGSSQQLYSTLFNTGSSFSFRMTGNNVKYSSSNKDVATVSAAGILTAKKVGSTTITVTTANGRFSDQITVKVLKGTWKKDSNGWWYSRGDGSYPWSEFEVIDGKTYYFDYYGYRVTGRQKIGSKWFYFDENGVMQTGWQTINGVRYYFDTNGAAHTGWLKIGNDWYFLHNDGHVHTGWMKRGDVFYFFNAKGVRQTGWLQRGSNRYYLDANGAMHIGWLKIGNNWYFMNNDGTMKTGWMKRGDVYYFFGSDGVRQTGWLQRGSNRYYLDANGAMHTGWLKIGNDWYFMNTDGTMKTGWMKRGGGFYFFDADGKRHTGWLQRGKNRYYMDINGIMKTGWLKIGSNFYFLNSNGIMQTGWMTRGSNKYYFSAEGVMATGRQKIDGKWYTFNANGVLQ